MSTSRSQLQAAIFMVYTNNRFLIRFFFVMYKNIRARALCHLNQWGLVKNRVQSLSEW